MEKIKVLMIDDNQSLVDMVKEYFENHNRIEVVLSCKDGEEGLDTIINKSSEYDIILLDLVMPKKDGLYVLDELNKRAIAFRESTAEYQTADLSDLETIKDYSGNPDDYA